MKYVMYPLLIMFFLSCINVLISLQPLENMFNQNYTYAQPPIMRNNTQVREGVNIVFGVDLMTGFFAVIVSGLAIGVLAGLQVLGSGINNVSTMVIFKTALFTMFWALLSVTGLGLLIQIPIIGWMIYMFLTLFYAVGVTQTIGFGSA